MDIPQEYINTERVSYFDLQEYINNFELSSDTLSHVEETSNNFSKYLEMLGKYFDYNKDEILLYWLDQSIEEMRLSTSIEKHTFRNAELSKGDLFFDKLSISHERIKKIHKFVCQNSDTLCRVIGEYRNSLVNVGVPLDKDHYQVLWYGVEAEDIKNFMDSFIKYYKQNGLSAKFSNPFIKASLAHLLFVRIHPFYDGNGRVARIMQNIAFTSRVNTIYNSNLRLSPLNISQNIRLNINTYANSINRIRFDLNSDNSESINQFLNFILNMYDEQLYYQGERIPYLDKLYEDYKRELNGIDDEKVKTQLVRAKVNKMFLR